MVVGWCDEAEPDGDGVDGQADDQPEDDGLDDEPMAAVDAQHLLEAVGHRRFRAGPRTNERCLVDSATVQETGQ